MKIIENEFEFDLDEHCDEGQWREFFHSQCWKEFRDTVKLRLIITRDSLEVCALEESGRYQGAALEDRFVLSFEQLVMSEFETKKKEEKANEPTE
jgi:hypothetical protein